MTRPIAYQPNITSFLSKVVPAVSRGVRYKIQPITRPKKTAPRPVRNMSFLLGFPTGDEKACRTENLSVSQISDEE
jgi:hypothetical protein